MVNKSIEEKTIKKHVAKVLSSESFHEASRLQQFFRYVVDKYCEGSTQEINQYAVGVEAFGFSEDFNPQRSSVVRLEAGRLRRRLALYYATEGATEELRIEIPKGSYAPHIKRAAHETDKVYHGLDMEAIAPRTDSQPAPPNLKIVVLPFQNVSGDNQLDFFAYGLAEEITSVLSLYKDFSIVPPIAAKGFTSEQTNLKVIDTEFGARYVLVASIRRAKKLVRIIVQLNDTKDSSLLWSSTFDTAFEVDNLIDIENEIAARVANSIANEYDGVIPRKVASESSNIGNPSRSSYEAVLRIHHYNLSRHPALIYNQTLDAIQNACKKDQKDPNLLSSLAELKLDGYAQGWSGAEELPVNECEELLDRALHLDKNCAYAYFVVGILRTNQRRRVELLKAVEGLKSFSHSVPSLAQAGWFLTIAGEYEEGIALLDKHLATLQYYPGWLRHGYYLYHYQNGRYEDALDEADRISMPGLLWVPAERAAALGKLGRYDEGRKAVRELLNLYPAFFDNPRRYLEMFIIDDDLLDDVIDGLNLSRN